MTIRSYLKAQDLVDAMGLPTYMAIFDDDNTGNQSIVDASNGVKAVLAESMILVTSWLPDIYTTLPPETGAAGIPTGGDSMPVLFKFAQLQYARMLGYRRHSEYVRTYSAEPGGALEKAADAFMERIQSGTQRVTPNDSPPETTPANVGGSTAADGPRIAMSNTNGTSNTGDW